MASLKQIKGKVEATKRINKVTKAMEAVSAVKMRKSQDLALKGRAYARAAVNILSRLAQSTYAKEHALFQKSAGSKSLVLLITSDKGLAGSLNASVIKSFSRICSENDAVDVYAVGKKGRDFAKRCARVLTYQENNQDDIDIENVRVIATELTELFLTGEYVECKVVYPHFASTFEQVAAVRTLLPLTVDGMQELISDMAGTAVAAETKEAPLYTVEPSPEEVLRVLIPHLVTIAVYHLMVETKASEHSARMVAMKNASDKSKEVTQQLNLKFNRARQAVITREVSEIISGIEAMAT